MTVANTSPYGTAHRDYVEATDDETQQRQLLAGRAWDMAAVVEEARKEYGDGACFFELDNDDQVARSALQAYLYELGYDATISQKKHGPGWLMRIGPPKRIRRPRQRPKVMERLAQNG